MKKLMSQVLVALMLVITLVPVSKTTQVGRLQVRVSYEAQDPSDYFAESYRNYTENEQRLKIKIENPKCTEILQRMSK